MVPKDEGRNVLVYKTLNVERKTELKWMERERESEKGGSRSLNTLQ